MPSTRRPKKQLLLSVVVPVYNEEEVIPLTHEELSMSSAAVANSIWRSSIR